MGTSVKIMLFSFTVLCFISSTFASWPQQWTIRINTGFRDDYMDLQSNASQKLIVAFKSHLLKYARLYIPWVEDVEVFRLRKDVTVELIAFVEVDFKIVVQWNTRSGKELTLLVSKLLKRVVMYGMMGTLVVDSHYVKPYVRGKELVYTWAVIRLYEDYDVMLTDLTSAKARRISDSVINEVNEYIHQFVPDYERTTVHMYRNNSILVDLYIESMTSLAVFTSDLLRKRVDMALSKVVEDGWIGKQELHIDTDYVLVHYPVLDVDTCMLEPCMHGANCTDTKLFFVCSCADGYAGAVCDTEPGNEEAAPIEAAPIEAAAIEAAGSPARQEDAAAAGMSTTKIMLLLLGLDMFVFCVAVTIVCYVKRSNKTAKEIKVQPWATKSQHHPPQSD